ncbi:MAG TPA: type II secretion system F family protein [Acidobacteriota bacterium]|nr:type II secretion system F family protein [Acidobacteriota bacterium]
MATDDGRLLSRSVLAASSEEVRRLFESDGLCVLSVGRDWKKLRLGTRAFGQKVRPKEFILFNQELMALIRAGYPILKSIETLSGRVADIRLKEILIKVEKDVRSGKSLSEAFLPFEDRFSKVYTASLMAGEKSGNLAGTIGRYVQYAGTIARTKSKIRSALVYPTLLIVFSFILLSILINFILPRFAGFYKDFESDMPALTTGLIAFAMAVRRHLVFILLAVGLGALAFLRWMGKEEGRVAFDRLKLKLPYGRTLWRESAASLFSRTMGLLLEAGISLLAAVGIASQAVPNRALALDLKGLPDSIKNGQSLTDSLAATGVMPGLALDMVRIGETSANLQGMLADVADFYDERVRARIDTLVSLIEPLVIIVMGLVVAGMLLAVYLPIFNIIRVAR